MKSESFAIEEDSKPSNVTCVFAERAVFNSVLLLIWTSRLQITSLFCGYDFKSCLSINGIQDKRSLSKVMSELVKCSKDWFIPNRTPNEEQSSRPMVSIIL